MRKVILDLAVTLDGFIEGVNGEIDWCIMDEDSNFNEFLAGIDAIFYGRTSYDLWGNYMPDEDGDELMREISETINTKTKYVFSTSKTTDHTKAIFINSDIKETVLELKQQAGKDIWLYGGAKLITTFINLGLVDELRLAVHPIILSNGKPLFQDINDRILLQLTETKTSKSGVILLTYKVKAKV